MNYRVCDAGAQPAVLSACLGRLNRKAFGTRSFPFSMQTRGRSMNILTKKYFIKRVDCLMNCPCEPSKCNGFFFFPPFNEGEDSYHEELAYQITVIACVDQARGAARGGRGLPRTRDATPHTPRVCLDNTKQDRTGPGSLGATAI